jgi:TatD DNase family protein
MTELWRDPKCVGIGEIGLDYHYDFAPPDVQQRVFAAQLAAAAALEHPLIIHCREAFEDTIALLLDHRFAGRKVVFHCFTGTAEEAARLHEHGWQVSFTGIVTFRKSHWLQAIARNYPSDRLMIETDSPYLSPEPVRGRMPNEPANVAHIARFLAQLRGIEPDALALQMRNNAVEFFNLRMLP